MIKVRKMKGHVGVPKRGAHTSKVKYNRVRYKSLTQKGMYIVHHIFS
jgi:hypothetical protein